jgi:anti-sigma factor RsiW
MTAQCESLRDDLKAYVDNELSWPNRLRVGRHLRGCASCREEVGAMQKITEEVRASESDVRVLDAGLRDKILAGVGTHVPDQNAGRLVSKPRFTMAELLVAAGLIGILAAILLPGLLAQPRKRATLFRLLQQCAAGYAVSTLYRAAYC